MLKNFQESCLSISGHLGANLVFRMNPLIERMADKHSSITFAKVNIEDYGDLASRYHISSIPAYVMFTNSSPSFSKIGAINELELEKLIVEAFSLETIRNCF